MKKVKNEDSTLRHYTTVVFSYLLIVKIEWME